MNSKNLQINLSDEQDKNAIFMLVFMQLRHLLIGCSLSPSDFDGRITFDKDSRGDIWFQIHLSDAGGYFQIPNFKYPCCHFSFDVLFCKLIQQQFTVYFSDFTN